MSMEKKLTHRLIPAEGNEVYARAGCDTISPREYWVGDRSLKFVDCPDCLGQKEEDGEGGS